MYEHWNSRLWLRLEDINRSCAYVQNEAVAGEVVKASIEFRVEQRKTLLSRCCVTTSELELRIYDLSPQPW